MVKVIKIGENEYRVSGTKQYVEIEYKSVIVEGEHYHKQVYIDRVFDFDADFDRRQNPEQWDTVELSIMEGIGGNIITFYDVPFLHSHASDSVFNFSQNRVANLCMGLHKEFSAFGEGIVGVYSTKETGYPRLAMRHFLANGFFELPVAPYGYGNWICAQVKVDHFLGLDFRGLPFEVKNMYKELVPEVNTAKSTLSSDQKFEIADRLLNLLIDNNYASNEQRTFHAFM